MAEPVKVRRMTDQEGQRLQQIVRRGSTSTVRYRRAMMILAGRPPRRRPDLRSSGQPLRPQGRQDPALGEEEQGRAVLHPDQRLLGQRDRGSLRPAAAVHHRQLRAPQRHRAVPSPAPLPMVAQRECPPPRRPGRSTPRTRAHPQRERHPLGRTRTGCRSLATAPDATVTAQRSAANLPITRVEPGRQEPQRRVRDRPPHPTALRPQRSRSPRSWPGMPRCRG